MLDRIEDLQAAEDAVRHRLSALHEIFGHAFAATDVVLRTYADRFAQEDSDSNVARAQRVLLTRLADDVRASFLLAERGYSFQAMTMAASILEIGFTIAYIRFSDDRAKRWLEWKNPFRMPWPVEELVKGAMVGTNAEVELAKGFRLWYTQFCWGKHASPLVQAAAPASISPAAHVINADPDFSPATVSRLGVALYGILQVVMLSTKPLFENDPRDVAGAWGALEQLGAELRKLHEMNILGRDNPPAGTS